MEWKYYTEIKKYSILAFIQSNKKIDLLHLSIIVGNVNHIQLLLTIIDFFFL